jgi:mRNA interferase MazF
MNYQWHVFLASLDPTKGSEQAGKRPVLVISQERINQLLPVVVTVQPQRCDALRHQSCGDISRGKCVAPEQLPVVNVIPLTSRKSPMRKIYPNEVLLPAGSAGLKVDSIALCYQIRTLDKSRLEQDMGELVETNLQQQIREAIQFQLEI